MRGHPPIAVSTEFAAESPITPHIGNLHMTATPHQRIASLKEQRQALQQRARSIRATTGTPTVPRCTYCSGRATSTPPAGRSSPPPAGYAPQYAGRSSRAGTGTSWRV